MSIKIFMPALSPTMTEGKIVRWVKKEGDKVKSGEVIAEIETDKATMEVEAADEGVLGQILVKAGSDMVAVNTPIAVLLEEGESLSDIAKVDEQSEDEVINDEYSYSEEEGKADMSDANALMDMMESDDAEETGRVKASPLARKMAKEADVDLASVEGSGPGGRIVKADVEKVISSGVGSRNSSSRAVAMSGGEKSGVTSLAPVGPAYRDVPLSTMRKVIAERLTEAKQNIPHFYLTMDCELEALEKMRKELNAKAEQLGLNYKLTINDFVIKAVAMAMRRVPAVNVSWQGDSLRMYNNVDISVAVSTPNGLITPIVRNADRRRLPDISRNVKQLAERARAGKLMPEEYQGGNFTISNLGMYGVKDFAAIINPPQACILAIGKAEQRLVVKDGSIAVANMMSCTLSVDHRAVDGAVGAEFLGRFKQIIEEPLVMML